MATTTGGTTYVTSTDLVANYPTASLALANRVDVVASGGPGLVKTAGYTITVADILGGNKFLYNSASPGTFTLPTSSLVDGMVVNVAQIGAGALTVSGGTIVGTTVTTAQYQSLQFVYVASGATWYSVAPPATAPGLAIVTPTSIANSGGSASASGGAVTFTGVSSVSLNGVFTNTYSNYLVVSKGTQSADAIISARVRASGTDLTTSTYPYQSLTASGASSTASNGTNSSFWFAYGSANDWWTTATIFSPQLAEKTGISAYGGMLGGYVLTSQAAVNNTSSYDGLTVFVGSGTLTGTIRVYGYKNS